MSTALALISPKGGSGKTTLALSMGDLLARSGIRCLIVDCDLSTNGATCFYEPELNAKVDEEQESIVSFYDLANGNTEIKAVSMRDNLDFIPSISQISNRYIQEGMALYSRESIPRTVPDIVEWGKEHYEVVLFDCQAGYTEILPILLPKMDIDLFVMEPDAISAASMRSLHLKIGSLFGKARLYQVFNKASDDDKKVYSHIDSTFFTNIGTLGFDWKIRQAFSRGQIPDMNTVATDMREELLAVCLTMFNGRVQKLIKINDNKTRLTVLDEKKQYHIKKRNEYRKVFLSRVQYYSISLILCFLVSLLFLPMAVEFNEIYEVLLPRLIFTISVSPSLSFGIFLIREKNAMPVFNKVYQSQDEAKYFSVISMGYFSYKMLTGMIDASEEIDEIVLEYKQLSEKNECLIESDNRE